MGEKFGCRETLLKFPTRGTLLFTTSLDFERCCLELYPRALYLIECLVSFRVSCFHLEVRICVRLPTSQSEDR